MDTNRNVIGNVNVEVKAGLYVDDSTAELCMDLLAIHLRNKGFSGILLRCCDGAAHPEVFAAHDIRDINAAWAELEKRQDTRIEEAKRECRNR